MTRVQFFPSDGLDKRLTHTSEKLGITKGMLAKQLLESIPDFEEILNKPNTSPPDDLISLADLIMRNMERFVLANPLKEFILNELESYREVPLSMRPILGKTIFNRICQGSSDTVKVVTILDPEGHTVVKKRQRAVLYMKGGE